MGRPRKEDTKTANTQTEATPAKPMSISEMLKAEAEENARRAREEIERKRKERAEREERERVERERAEREEKERAEREAEEAERRAKEEAKRKAEREAAAKKWRVARAEQDYIMLNAAKAALDKVKASGNFNNLFQMPIRDGSEFMSMLETYLYDARKTCLES